MTARIIHLHHGYVMGPKLLRGITLGIAACGASKVPREVLTSFPDDATCPDCLKQLKKGATDQPDG